MDEESDTFKREWWSHGEWGARDVVLEHCSMVKGC